MTRSSWCPGNSPLASGRQPARRAWSLWTLLYLAGGVGLAHAAGGPCVGEADRAQGVLQRIQQEWPLRSSTDAVTDYVRALGMRLGRQADRGGKVQWNFWVVRNRAPNAFSIGGGYTFVTEGAVSFAQNESEMAAILAHEIGHEMAGHFCRSAQTAQSRGWFDFLSPRPREEDRIGIGSLTQVIDLAKEQEADQLAVGILQAAGFDPRSMLAVARRLAGRPGLHSEDPRRVQSLEALLNRVPGRPATDSGRFREIRGILAAEGFIR